MERKIMKKIQQKRKYTSGNLVPQATDAEKAVIGAVINFRDAYDSISFLTPDMFYDPLNQTLFRAIVSLHETDVPVDVITVTQQIAAMGKTNEVPIWAVVEISTNIVSNAHIVRHALIVKQKYLQREAMYLFMQMQSEAADDTNEIDDVLFNAGKGIEALQETMVGWQLALSYRDISQLFYDDINKRIEKFNAGNQTGVTTGLTDLDRITSGWQPSELVILAARPAMGKTAMALHFAHSAASAGVPVVVFSLEMSRIQLYNRSVLSESNIQPSNLKTGNLMNDLKEMDQSVLRLSNLPIYVNDDSSINMASIRSICRLMHKKNQCGIVIIDYLQLITAGKERYGNREQEVAAMSRGAKLIAKELDIPVILLSQLNRDVDRRQEKLPQLSDLRESGAIEQDADMVLFIHRPQYYDEQITDINGNPVENAGELIISKYRNGAVGKVKFMHNETLTRIYDYKLTEDIQQLNFFNQII